MKGKGRRAALDWSVLVPRLVHPTKVLIIEAMHWIDRPLASSDLEQVFGKRLGVSNISYHVKTLADARILREVSRRQVRGAWKTVYRLTYLKS